MRCGAVREGVDWAGAEVACDKPLGHQLLHHGEARALSAELVEVWWRDDECVLLQPPLFPGLGGDQ